MDRAMASSMAAAGRSLAEDDLIDVHRSPGIPASSMAAAGRSLAEDDLIDVHRSLGSPASASEAAEPKHRLGDRPSPPACEREVWLPKLVPVNPGVWLPELVPLEELRLAAPGLQTRTAPGVPDSLSPFPVGFDGTFVPEYSTITLAKDCRPAANPLPPAVDRVSMCEDLHLSTYCGQGTSVHAHTAAHALAREDVSLSVSWMQRDPDNASDSSHPWQPMRGSALPAVRPSETMAELAQVMEALKAEPVLQARERKRAGQKSGTSVVRIKDEARVPREHQPMITHFRDPSLLPLDKLQEQMQGDQEKEARSETEPRAKYERAKCETPTYDQFFHAKFGGCRRFEQRGLTDWLKNRCSNCGTPASDPCHHATLRCSICGRAYSSFSNTEKSCAKHPQSVVIVRVGDRNLYAYKCCPERKQYANSLQDFINMTVPHGPHQ